MFKIFFYLILAAYSGRSNYQPANSVKRVQPQRIESTQTGKETEFGECVQLPNQKTLG